MSSTTATARACWNARDLSDYWSLTGAIAMVGLALGTLLPLTSLQLDRQGFTGGTIGAVIALHALGLVLAILVGERCCARYGSRRAVEFFGVASAAVGFLMQGLTDPLSLAASLFVLGVFLGVVLNTVETWVNAVIPDAQRGRWLAVHCTVFTLFQFCGPVLLQQLPPQHAFHVCALLMLLAWPLYRRLSTRTLSEETDLQNDATPWFIHLQGAPVVVLSTALFALFDTLVLALLPVYALAQGMGTGSALASASVVLAGDTSLEIVIGVLADRFGRVRVHAACAMVLMCSALLLPFTIGSVSWWPLLFLMGGSAGGIYVLSMMACGQKFKDAQLLRMTALLGSVWGVASIMGPLITGAFMARSITWSIPVVVFSMAALLLAALAYEKRRNHTRLGGRLHA